MYYNANSAIQVNLSGLLQKYQAKLSNNLFFLLSNLIYSYLYYTQAKRKCQKIKGQTQTLFILHSSFKLIVLPHTTHITGTGLIAVVRVAIVEVDYPSIGSIEDQWLEVLWSNTMSILGLSLV